MRALWFEDGKPDLRDDIPEPQAGPEELVVRVRYAGICGTDMELLRGYHDFRGIPGHEFIGTVVEGPPDWLNERIVAGINVGCGSCRYCRRGERNHCPDRDVIGIKNRPGAFSELLAVPIVNAFRVPGQIGDRDATLVEPLAAALEILEQVTITADTKVLVVGAGRLAQLIVQVLAGCSRHVQVLVRRRERKPQIDALDVECVQPGKVIRGACDLVVECSGRPEGFMVALDAVRPRGTIVMKSTYANSLTIPASRIVVDEINLVGSRCGPFEGAIQWLQQGKVRLSHLTFREFSLSDYEAAFAAAADPSVYKVLIDPRR